MSNSIELLACKMASKCSMVSFIVLTVGLLASFLGHLNAAWGNGFEITLGKSARTLVVLPINPNHSEQYAARELIYHIKQSTGVALREVRENEITPEAGNFIYVGNCAHTRRSGILVEKFARNEWRVRVAAEPTPSLFLVGHDDPRNFHPLQIYSEAGTLYAVYDFLDTFLGVRWLWPGPLGEVIPRKAAIQVPYGTEYRGTPKFLISSFRLNAAVDNFAAWTLPENRNSYMEASIAWLRRHRFAHLTAGQPTHAFRDYFNRYGSTYPEIFNQLPDGTRRPDPTYFGGKWPALISMDMGEPTLTQLAVDNWLLTKDQPSLYFDASTYLDASENDTYGKSVSQASLDMDVRDPRYEAYCLPDLMHSQSSGCASWENRMQNARIAYDRGMENWHDYLGSLTDRYAKFLLRVQSKANALGHKAKVVGMAYANYRRPPITTRLNKDIFIHYVPNLAALVNDPKVFEEFKMEWQGWINSGAQMVYRPNFTFNGHNMPISYAKMAGAAFQAAAGAVNTQNQPGMVGFDYDLLTGQFAAQGPSLYLLARLNMYPLVHVEQLLEEYYSGFGEYRAIAKEYFDFMEQVSQSVPEDEYTKIVLTVPNASGNAYFYHIAYRWFTPEILKKAWAILNRANQITTLNTENLFRLDFLKIGLQHAEMTLAAAAKYRQYLAGGRRDSTEFCRSISALDAYRATIERSNASNIGFLVNYENLMWRNGEIPLNPLGAGELINGGFECSMYGWNFYPRVGQWASAILDQAEASHSGKKSGQMTCVQTDAAGKCWGQLYRENLPIAPNRRYRLSAWIKTNQEFAGKIGFWFRSGNTPSGNHSLEVSGTQGEWQEIMLDGIVSNASTASVYLNSMDGVGSLWFDDIRLIQAGGTD